MNIQQWIARTGENPKFVAFMAHMWFAFGCLTILHELGLPRWPLAFAFVCVSAIKEFWFDLNYETAPRQTVADSTLDWIGYLSGVFLFCLGA